MIVGITLFRLSADPQYSPQFNRGGNAATFTCNVTGIAGGIGVGLNIDVEHKNSEDTSWSVLASFSLMTANGTYPVDGAAIKEQLRFKYTVAGAVATNAVHFNMLAPSWRPY